MIFKRQPNSDFILREFLDDFSLGLLDKRTFNSSDPFACVSRDVSSSRYGYENDRPIRMLFSTTNGPEEELFPVLHDVCHVIERSITALKELDHYIFGFTRNEYSLAPILCELRTCAFQKHLSEHYGIPFSIEENVSSFSFMSSWSYLRCILRLSEDASFKWALDKFYEIDDGSYNFENGLSIWKSKIDDLKVCLT